MKHPLISNDTPYEHIGKYGTKIYSDRCDFKNGVVVEKDADTSEEWVISDIVECMTYHALAIWQHLNGFSGYDTLSYTFKVREE